MDEAQELLFESAKEGDVGGIEAALDEGAHVVGGSAWACGRGALHIAAAEGHLDAVRLLLSRGADPTLRSTLPPDHGGVSLHLAAGGGHVEVMEELLKRGGDTEARDDKGRKAVHIAAYNGQLNALKMLHRHHCNISAQSHARSTALHYAAAHGDLEVVKWLVGAGVRTDSKDKSGRTAKDVAKERDHAHVYTFLKEHVRRKDMDTQSGQRSSFRKKKRSLSMTNLFRGRSEGALDRTPLDQTPGYEDSTPSSFEPPQPPPKHSPTMASEISSFTRDGVTAGVDVEAIRKVEDWRARRVVEQRQVEAGGATSHVEDNLSLLSTPSTRYHQHHHQPAASVSLAPSAADASFTYMQDDHLSVLRDRDQEIYRLRDRLRQWEEKWAEARQGDEELRVLHAEVKQREDELKGLREAVRQGEEEKIVWEEAVRKLNQETRTQVTEARREADEARREVDEARREADEARREANEARRQADEAKSEADEARKQENEVRRKVDEVRKEADEARREADEARLRPSEAERESSEARQELEETKEKLDETKEALKQAKEELKQAQEKEDEARREAEETKKEEEELRRGMEEERKKYEEEKMNLEHQVYRLSLQNQQHLQYKEQQAKMEAEQRGADKARLQRMASLEATVAHLTQALAISKAQVATKEELVKKGQENTTKGGVQEYRRREEAAAGDQEEERGWREKKKEEEEEEEEKEEEGRGGSLGTLRREVQRLQQRLESNLQHLALAERKQREQEAQSESIIAALRRQVEVLSQGREARNDLEGARMRNTEASQQETNAKGGSEAKRTRDIEAMQREVNEKLEVWRRDFQKERESSQRQLREVSEQLETERKNWTRTLDLSQRQLLNQKTEHTAERKEWVEEKEALETQLEKVTRKLEAERKAWLREKEALERQVKDLAEKNCSDGNTAIEKQVRALSEQHDKERKALIEELDMSKKQLQAVTAMLSATQQTTQKQKEQQQKVVGRPRQQGDGHKQSVTQFLQELVEAKRDEGKKLQNAPRQHDKRGPDLVMSAVSASGQGSPSSSSSSSSPSSPEAQRSVEPPASEHSAQPSISTHHTLTPKIHTGSTQSISVPPQHKSTLNTQSSILSTNSTHSSLTSISTDQATLDTQSSIPSTSSTQSRSVEMQHKETLSAKSSMQSVSSTQSLPTPAQQPHSHTQPGMESHLVSLNNSAYLSAILQCLYAIPSLREYFTSEAYRRCLNPHSAYKGEVAEGLARIFASMGTGDHLTARRDTLSLQKLVGQHIGGHTTHHTPYSGEPTTSLLTALHTDLATSKDESVIRDWVMGEREEVVRCGRERGGEVKRTRDQFFVITLPLHRHGPHVSLQAALWQQFREKATECACTYCMYTHTCLHHTLLTHLPSVLIILLHRERGASEGRTTKVEFPSESLTLTQHMKTGCSPSYQLFGVVGDEGGGEFSAFCRNPHDPSWRHYHDHKVTATSLQRVLALQQPHVLLYRGTALRVTSPVPGRSSAV